MLWIHLCRHSCAILDLVQHRPQALRYESSDDSQLASFIIDRAACSIDLAVPLHWYLYTEWEDPTFGPRAGAVHKRFQKQLPPGSPIVDAISKQMGMVAQLHCIVKELKASRGSATRKTERLQEMVGPGGPLAELMHLQVPLPLNPGTTLQGVLPEECIVFKSALSPLRLTFRATDGGCSERHCVLLLLQHVVRRVLLRRVCCNVWCCDVCAATCVLRRVLRHVAVPSCIPVHGSSCW